MQLFLWCLIGFASHVVGSLSPGLAFSWYTSCATPHPYFNSTVFSLAPIPQTASLRHPHAQQLSGPRSILHLISGFRYLFVLSTEGRSLITTLSPANSFPPSIFETFSSAAMRSSEVVKPSRLPMEPAVT
jgi:hypothetical protein